VESAAIYDIRGSAQNVMFLGGHGKLLTTIYYIISFVNPELANHAARGWPHEHDFEVVEEWKKEGRRGS
jgi:hypothetical protein